MTACIFCKIIEGTIPSVKIYEDEHVLAFMDIAPVTKGHALLIPKIHRENIYDLSAEEAAQLFSVAPQIANALKDSFAPAGMNLLQNNGTQAGQTVFHYHLNFIPRYDETDGFQPTFKTNESESSSERIQEIAVGIRAKLQK